MPDNADSTTGSSSVTVVSVGGSIVVPDGVDVAFVSAFAGSMRAYLDADRARRLVLVIGGGATARTSQAAARKLDPNVDSAFLDEIGIAATRVNAAIVKAAFAELCSAPVFTDPTTIAANQSRVMVGGGWKPGFSTDTVAVYAAQAVGADRVVNLSNIAMIYTADPRTDPDARPLQSMSWQELFAIVGDDWTPGKNTPFDPVATRLAASLGMTVIAADGRNLENLDALLAGRRFVGTTIS
ncbi:MAG: UMP kinase [Spirochaetaceae bacterium]|nr:MAG: UMP kinase [Spirochaetaceae bacterium]